MREKQRERERERERERDMIMKELGIKVNKATECISR